MQRGFFGSLFDISFTSYVTTKIVKVLYVMTLAVIAVTALVFVAGAFHESTGLGVLTLFVLAPLAALIYAVYARVLLEFIVQVFRIGELLRDQSQLQRAAFATAGWLPAADGPAAPETLSAQASPPVAPAAPAAEGAPCPNCGAAPTPGAQFCRACGHRLI